LLAAVLAGPAAGLVRFGTQVISRPAGCAHDSAARARSRCAAVSREAPVPGGFD